MGGWKGEYTRRASLFDRLTEQQNAGACAVMIVGKKYGEEQCVGEELVQARVETDVTFLCTNLWWAYG